MRPINRLGSLTTIAFDWGNTLMKEFPYSSPMVEWPIVEAIPGSLQTLTALKPHYRLVLATSADVSTASQIEAALSRVGLGGLLDKIFTFKEVGSRKPLPAFFDGICAQLGTTPPQMLMVGDWWNADVDGALQCGWNTAWFNPQRQACPGLSPAHQLELHNLDDLPGQLKYLDLPDIAECLRWMQVEGTSQTILIHVQMVAAIAYQLAEWLASRGERVNPILAQRGGLLHDLAKLSAARPEDPSRHHGDVAAMRLLEAGQLDLAEIARRHLFFLPGEESDYAPRTWEEKLVYFADKLVEATRLVSLEERVAALNQRYVEHIQRFAAGLPAVQKIESDICKLLDVTPAALFESISRAIYEERPVIAGRQN